MNLEKIFIRSNESLSIIHKVLSRSEHFLTDRVQPIDAFGFPSAARGEKEPFDGLHFPYSQPRHRLY